MKDANSTAKIKLVTIIAPHEVADGVIAEVVALGATGYTSMRVDGKGRHGVRQAGAILSANVRIEVLGHAELAKKILALINKKHSADAVVAYALDVDAVPAAKFE